MATLVKEIYEAFIEVGASKETAGRVADSLGESIEKFVRKDENNLATRDELAKVDKKIDLANARLQMLRTRDPTTAAQLTSGGCQFQGSRSSI